MNPETKLQRLGTGGLTLAEYIDREATLKAISYNTIGPYDILHIFEALGRVEAIPSADATEVVRCMECKYRDDDDQCPILFYLKREVDEHKTDDMDYCSFGERQDGTK